MANCSIGVDPGSSSYCSTGKVTISAVTYPAVLDPTCTFCTAETKSTIATDSVNPFYKLTNSFKTSDQDTGVEIGIVTEEVITGAGQFDKYMRAGRNQLNTQYELGRIKGADYTAAYIAMQESMMNQANQFILGKYQADALLAKMEAELGEMKEKGILERNLLKVQTWKTELDGLLIVQKNKTEQIQHQVLATQEEETRRTGVVERQLKTEQSRTTVAETELKTVQKIEMGLTGQVDRASKEAQAKDTLTAASLKATQESELIANGSSKRALENGQNKVGAAQCELYAAQAAGFGDRNRNDTFKTIMNAWAVDVAENDNTETPDALHTSLNSIMNNAVSTSDGL